MRNAILTCALAALAASGAQASRTQDPRLVHRSYSADEVVRIDGKAHVQASIVFSEDEHIENVAIGDSNAWQVTPNKRTNMLFVKPLAARARTNMTVVTSEHTYLFDLVAGTATNPLYILRFTYPEKEKSKRLAVPGGSSELKNEELALTGEAPAVRPRDPAALNFAWQQKGSSRKAVALLPTRVYDDGEATYLAWALGRPLPAILMRNDRGEEGPVNFAVREDIIVIDGVPPAIILRSGKDSAILERMAPRAMLSAAQVPAPTPLLAIQPPEPAPASGAGN
jgi:type IV secretion system protein VirB9